MSILARIAMVVGVLALSACGGATGSVSPTVGGWKLQDVNVNFGEQISRTASGEEFGSNFVWNGFSGGNRKKQVVGLFKSAMNEVGQTAMNGGQAVNMNVTVTYFHALTDQSRVWCCGEHRIYANLAVVDAASGNTLAAEDNVYLGRIALGGLPGIVAVASGRDQDVRVREGIVNGTLDWLSKY